MSQQSPAIVQLAERVLVEIEEAVRTFPRYHKYAVGSELRSRARSSAQAACRAWRDVEQRTERFRQLEVAIDDLKLELQTAQRLKAFRSFAQFEPWTPVTESDDDFDGDDFDEDFDDEDPGDECGRWRNGVLTKSCSKAGSEDCDFECPYRGSL
jgi:hypothetical protein